VAAFPVIASLGSQRAPGHRGTRSVGEWEGETPVEPPHRPPRHPPALVRVQIVGSRLGGSLPLPLRHPYAASSAPESATYFSREMGRRAGGLYLA